MSQAVLTLNAFSIESNDLISGNKQDQRFYKILIVLLLTYFVFGMVVPYVERVEIPREIKEQVPPQLTRILLKEKEIPPPEVIEELPPEKVEEPEPQEPPKTKREVAKEKAQSSGLAAMKDDLFSLRDAFVVKPNSSSTLLKEKTTEVTPIKRDLLAAKANEKSQHLASAKTTSTEKVEQLAEHTTQTVRLAEDEVLADTIASSEEISEPGIANVRSEMKLRQTLEANKGRLYSLYNRSLRKDPFLKGKVLFEIEIQPDGSVSQVSIQSSELGDEKLERRLMLILRAIDFGVEDVSVMTTVWAIEFLPR